MESLVAQYHRPLLNFFIRHSQNTWDAEELTQEVFCKILKREDRSVDQYPESYLYTIAWSVLRDRARRDRSRQRDKHVVYVDELTEAIPSSVEAALDSEKQYARFLSALKKLKPKTRNVFVLNRYEGMTYSQIAENYGISVSSVEKHMMQALRTIKHAVEEND